MTKIASLLTLFTAALVCLMPVAPAQAQRERVFVASYGSDSNPCTFGSPCKTFQNAVNVVAQGGEVSAIDSAGFGPVTISHAVTITSPNGVEAGIAAPSGGSPSILINAGASDVIHLNGLTLDGSGIASNVGISFNGGSLFVENSVIKKFHDGIVFAPSVSASSQLWVSNTRITDNSRSGIAIGAEGSGTVTAVLDHVAIENNGVDGLAVSADVQTINVIVNDSMITNNQVGILTQTNGPAATVMVRNSTIGNNSVHGIFADSGTTVWLTRSTITGNASGWSANGTVTSFDDNNIVGNTNDEGTPPSVNYE
jgi:hypothetical protein